MIDFHCHILAGIDDGPENSAGSVAIAGILSRTGFTGVHCTPHMIRGIYDNDPRDVRQRVSRLEEILRSESIPLKLTPAAEYYFDEYLAEILADPLPVANRHILVEAPPYTTFDVVAALAQSVLARGLTPLIAHPERSRILSGQSANDAGMLSSLSLFFGQAGAATKRDIPPFIESLRKKGCRFQGNLGSLAGIYGDKVRSRALTLTEHGVYSCFGSDAHRPEGLEDILQKGIETLRKIAGPENAAKLLRGDCLC